MGQPSNLTEKLAQWTFAPTIWTPGEKRAELDCASFRVLVSSRSARAPLRPDAGFSD